jgi:purine-nucleoside phosphorylase
MARHPQVHVYVPSLDRHSLLRPAVVYSGRYPGKNILAIYIGMGMGPILIRETEFGGFASGGV